jgi:hypothetical protein
MAAHMAGTVGGGDIVYAGKGMNFVDPKGQYDASKYQGISFWGRRGPGSTPNVRLKVPDVATEPDGKVCSECFNDFGADLTFSEAWHEAAQGLGQSAHLGHRLVEALRHSVPGERKEREVRHLGGRDPVHRLQVS